MTTYGVDRSGAAGGSGSAATPIDETIIAAKGDLIVGGASDDPQILTVGANDSILVADSAQSLGVKWSAGSAAFQSIVTSATVETGPAIGDLIMISDVSLTPDNGRSMTLANMLAVVNGLTEDTAPDQANDYFLSYDSSASAAKKVTIVSQLQRLNALTEDTTPDTAADFLLSYDASASTVKKVKPQNIGAQTLGTPATTTSGTAHDYTGLPTGVKEIIIGFSGTSLSGTSNIDVQIGSAGGLETTGYVSNGAGATNVGVLGSAAAAVTTGFRLTYGSAAADVWHGSAHLTLIDASTNTWSFICVLMSSTSTVVEYSCGSKSLNATLDRVRIHSANDTDTFDAGKLNISYKR